MPLNIESVASETELEDTEVHAEGTKHETEHDSKHATHNKDFFIALNL